MLQTWKAGAISSKTWKQRSLFFFSSKKTFLFFLISRKSTAKSYIYTSDCNVIYYITNPFTAFLNRISWGLENILQDPGRSGFVKVAKCPRSIRSIGHRLHVIVFTPSARYPNSNTRTFISSTTS